MSVASEADVRLTSTTQLIERAQAGDPRAADELYERYFPRLCRWARALMHGRSWGPHESSDVAQHTALHVMRGLSQFRSRGHGSARGWIATILWNRMRDLVRRQRTTPSAPAAWIPERRDAEPSALEALIVDETRERYRAHLQTLSADERRAVILWLEDRLSMSQIAAALGRPSKGAARVLLHRALKRLVEAMARDHPTA